MKNFESAKGITLLTLIVYIGSLLVALAILATVSAYFANNFNEMREYTTNIGEFDRFNVFFLEEVKRTGNSVRYPGIGRESNEIEFVNGNGVTAFRFEGNRIYYEQADERAIVLASRIDVGPNGDYMFRLERGERRETIIHVNAQIDGEIRNIAYVMPRDVRVGMDEDNFISWPSTTPEIGDYVAFTPTSTTHTVPGSLSGHRVPNNESGVLTNQTFQTENLQWRIMSLENNQITLVSATQTNQAVRLQGARRIQ